MPDDHSEVVPLLPIPNRTVKRLCADASAGSRVKVGHRQALTQPPKPPRASWCLGVWAFWTPMLTMSEMALLRDDSSVDDALPLYSQGSAPCELGDQ